LDPAAVAEWQRQLEQFPEGDYDDVLDALADLDQVQMLGGAPPLVLMGSRPNSTQAERDEADERARRASVEMVERAVRTQGAYWPASAGRR
jgi:hypothetical protein